MKRFMMCLCLLMMATNVVNASAQSQKFATIQYDSGNGSKLTVLSGFKSAECNKLIQTIDSGIRVDCPHCRIDFSGCSRDAGQYQDMWEKKKFIVPYVIFNNQRYFRAGIPRQGLEDWCVNTEHRF